MRWRHLMKYPFRGATRPVCLAPANSVPRGERCRPGRELPQAGGGGGQDRQRQRDEQRQQVQHRQPQLSCRALCAAPALSSVDALAWDHGMPAGNLGGRGLILK